MSTAVTYPNSGQSPPPSSLKFSLHPNKGPAEPQTDGGNTTQKTGWGQLLASALCFANSRLLLLQSSRSKPGQRKGETGPVL